MRILLVSATFNEIIPLLNFLHLPSREEFFQTDLSFENHSLDILVSGIGSPSTLLRLTQRLERKKYDFGINLGICGAFEKKYPIGSVLQVSEDRFGDLGIENANGEFLDAYESGLACDTFPFTQNGWLVPSNSHTFPWPSVKGVTVNTVTGNNASIDKLYKKYRADVETMEGAAFFMSCMSFGLPCIQIKSISNYIEPRNKDNWDMPLAIKNVNNAFFDLLKLLHTPR